MGTEMLHIWFDIDATLQVARFVRDHLGELKTF